MRSYFYIVVTKASLTATFLCSVALLSFGTLQVHTQSDGSCVGACGDNEPVVDCYCDDVCTQLVGEFDTIDRLLTTACHASLAHV